MSRTRLGEFLVAGGLIATVAVEGTERYVVRDLLAALLIFCALLGVLGLTILASFLLGEGVIRCFGLLLAWATSVGLHQPAAPVTGRLTHGIGKI